MRPVGLLKIGIYQSVNPCSPDDLTAIQLRFPVLPLAESKGIHLRFRFVDSGSTDDGYPLYVSDAVEVCSE